MTEWDSRSWCWRPVVPLRQHYKVTMCAHCHKPDWLKRRKRRRERSRQDEEEQKEAEMERWRIRRGWEEGGQREAGGQGRGI